MTFEEQGGDHEEPDHSQDVIDDGPELGDDMPLNPLADGPFPSVEDVIEDHDPAKDPNRWVESEEHEREIGGEA